LQSEVFWSDHTFDLLIDHFILISDEEKVTSVKNRNDQDQDRDVHPDDTSTNLKLVF
jgi:hypothetical protein